MGVINEQKFYGRVPVVKGRGRKTDGDYSTETLTFANLALCDWGQANIAENTVTNVIGQKLVDLFKRRAVHLEPGLAYVFNGGSHFKLSKNTSAHYASQL